ncbi:unnamed protein product [Notodromas monacha]|uniref:Nop domain-containing protein n=1 Tax=Notodromas monacha TaxID=399045 RepID=A0A7R9BGE9_9CRUS|nr:unnamed protein product [Notodromas monacha]CAG0915016.1 unnamed protein product [Notodromas monacha]
MEPKSEKVLSAAEYAEQVREWMSFYYVVNHQLRAQVTRTSTYPEEPSRTTEAERPSTPNVTTDEQPARPGDFKTVSSSGYVWDQGVLFGIAPFWKRICAEFVDFIILLVIKFFITYIAIDHYDMIVMDGLLDFSDLSAYVDLLELAGNEPGVMGAGLRTMIEVSTEVVLLEMIHRLAVCFYEGLWIWSSCQATPGKMLFGLKVVSCDWVVPAGEDAAVVFPAKGLSLLRSLSRGAVKNVALAFFLPITFSLFYMQYNRTAYDHLVNAIVVQHVEDPVDIFPFFTNFRRMLRRNPFFRLESCGKMLLLFETPVGYAFFKILDEKKLKQADNVWSELHEAFQTPEGASSVSQAESLTGIPRKEYAAMALGLAHSLSRYKLKFSPDKVDVMIVQAISVLEDLDKELNNYVMRCKEWYGWHFPELTKIVTDNIAYVRLIKKMGERSNAADMDFSDIIPEDVEQQVKATAEISMGTELSEEDQLNIGKLCDTVLEVTEYRAELYDYLKNRMLAIAPNLTALLGELVGARLISKAGSLLNLAKHPASTVQILGAEKALFRALKTRHDTPKYGLIYHAQLVSSSSAKLRGKISRMLAAKAALAIRVDALGEDPTPSADVGITHRATLELRIASLEQGKSGRFIASGRKFAKHVPKSEAKVFPAAADSTLPTESRKKKKIKKEENIKEEEEAMEEDQDQAVEQNGKKKKKSKAPEDDEEVQESSPKKKKKKSQAMEVEEQEPEQPVKKKKKKSVVKEEVE